MYRVYYVQCFKNVFSELFMLAVKYPCSLEYSLVFFLILALVSPLTSFWHSFPSNLILALVFPLT